MWTQEVILHSGNRSANFKIRFVVLVFLNSQYYVLRGHLKYMEILGLVQVAREDRVMGQGCNSL